VASAVETTVLQGIGCKSRRCFDVDTSRLVLLVVMAAGLCLVYTVLHFGRGFRLSSVF